MSSRRIWLAVLATAAVLRLLTLGAYPLHDTTEARYAEIARIMVVSDNWVTPQIEPGVPFWAKPPLSIWANAVSFKMLGFNEFAARLPVFLLTLLALLIVFALGRRLFGDVAAIAACVIALTTIVGFVDSGAVMTDAALLLATTVALASFCGVILGAGTTARYGLFVGLGLGLLAKGPIAVVLIGMPILAWTLWRKDLAWLWRSLPWIAGTGVVLAIAGPWYWLAESRTPGFLEYFIVGEHWLRFVESGWQGDLYGNAHSRPRGTIWFYGLVGTLPWSLVALYAAWRKRRSAERFRDLPPALAFLVLWALTPLLFFTFAGNILPAYVLPAVPAFALLLGRWVSTRGIAVASAGLFVPGLIALAAITGLLACSAHRSQKDLVEYHYSSAPSAGLYYYPRLPMSASFYSRGRARVLDSEAALERFVVDSRDGLVAIRGVEVSRIADDLAACLAIRAVIHNYAVFTPSADCAPADDRF